MTAVKELTSGRPLPVIFNFALPLLMGNMLQQTYSLVDAAIVGKFLGMDALASVGASSSVIFLILGFCNGCCGGFGIPVAQKFGARDHVAVRQYVYNSLRLAAIISVCLAVVTCIFCSTILRTMSTPDSIYDGAFVYLFVTFVGIPCTFFYNLLSCIIRALGDSKTPFFFLLFSTVLNIVLDLICILIIGWGVLGAALATVVSQGVSAVLCYIFMRRKFSILKSTMRERRYESNVCKRLLSTGVPMGLQFSITAIGSIMLQSSNNALGTECVAAFTAAMRIKMFFLTPLESLGIAMSTFAGQNFGAGLPRRVLDGVKASGVLMIVYCVTMFCVLMLWTKPMVMAFVDSSEIEVIEKAVLFMHVSIAFFPILGVLCILRYTIQGVGYTSFAMLSGVMEMIARIMVSLLIVPIWKYTSVCFGDPTAWIFADLFLIPAFIYVYHKISNLKAVVPK